LFFQGRVRYGTFRRGDKSRGGGIQGTGDGAEGGRNVWDAKERKFTASGREKKGPFPHMKKQRDCDKEQTALKRKKKKKKKSALIPEGLAKNEEKLRTPAAVKPKGVYKFSVSVYYAKKGEKKRPRPPLLPVPE